MRDMSAIDRGVLDQKRLLNVTVTRSVPVSPESVWRLISHPTTRGAALGLELHEPIDGSGEGLGARLLTKESLFRYESRITTWEPGRAVGLTITKANWLRLLFEAYYLELDVIEDSDGVQLRYRVAMRGTWLFWLLSAYTIGHSVADAWFTGRVALKRLEVMALDGND